MPAGTRSGAASARNRPMTKAVPVCASAASSSMPVRARGSMTSSTSRPTKGGIGLKGLAPVVNAESALARPEPDQIDELACIGLP